MICDAKTRVILSIFSPLIINDSEILYPFEYSKFLKLKAVG